MITEISNNIGKYSEIKLDTNKNLINNTDKLKR